MNPAILIDDIYHGLSTAQTEITDTMERLNDLSLSLRLGTLEEVQTRNYEESNMSEYTPVLNTEHKSVKQLLDDMNRHFDRLMGDFNDPATDADDREVVKDYYWTFMTTHSKLCDALGFPPSLKTRDVSPEEARSWCEAA